MLASHNPTLIIVELMGNTMHTLAGTLNQFIQTLTSYAVDSPRLSAEVLLAHALQVSREDFLKQRILNPTISLPDPAYESALALLERRLLGEPVAYITGEKEFYGRPFTVTPATLIPRPETELLIDTALEFIKSAAPPLPPRFIDLGTGSGCIAITLALEASHWHGCWQGLAIDMSTEALEVATKNAQKLQATNLNFAKADFHTLSLTPKSLGIFATNPPYISSTEYNNLSHEVRLFEPHNALVPTLENTQKTIAGLPSDQMAGTEDICHLVKLAQKALHPEGLLLIEIGYLQGEYALAQVTSSLWKNQKICQDLAGLDRLLMAQKA